MFGGKGTWGQFGLLGLAEGLNPLLCFFFCIMAKKSDTDDVGQLEHYYSYPAVSRDASLTHYQHGRPGLLREAWPVVADVIRTHN
jgi:hypothetical protein